MGAYIMSRCMTADQAPFRRSGAILGEWRRSGSGAKRRGGGWRRFVAADANE